MSTSTPEVTSACSLSPSSKRTAPRTTLSLYRSELLRGTDLASLLERFGIHFRESAGGIVGLPSVAAENYEKSFKVAELDMFLSHSWHAEWLLKYMTLLLQFNHTPALLLTCFASAVVMAWRGPGYSHVSLLSAFGLLLMYLFTLIFWQSVVHLISLAMRLPKTTIFVDTMCIHQNDPDLKTAGIQSFGAFLAHSRVMLVAWDPSYFSRLWCTYELAAFKAARPQAPIIIAPLFVTRLYLVMFAFTTARVLLDFEGLLAANLAPSAPYADCDFVALGPLYLKSLMQLHGAVQVCAFLRLVAEPCLYSCFFMWYLHDLSRFDKYLASFSIRNAKCFCCSNNHVNPVSGNHIEVCDRDLVYASIGHWYAKGDCAQGLQAFDTLVRRGLRAETMPLLFQGLNYGYAVGLGIVPFLIFGGQNWAMDLSWMLLLTPARLTVYFHISFLVASTSLGLRWRFVSYLLVNVLAVLLTCFIVNAESCGRGKGGVVWYWIVILGSVAVILAGHMRQLRMRFPSLTSNRMIEMSPMSDAK